MTISSTPTPSLEARLARLRAEVDALVRERYPRIPEADLAQQAAMCGDTDYLLARLQLADAERDAALHHVHWMAPGRPCPPKEALSRIKALCSYWPDLYEAGQAVLATHPTVARDLLAKAMRQCRADAEAYSPEDLTSMLIGGWNGGRQGFEAVMRTRKNADRKAAALPWGGTQD